MSGSNSLSLNEINSLPQTPSVEVKSKFEDCEETFLDEDGWREEAKGIIRDVEKYVKFVSVSEVLENSKSQIYLNLITREENIYTVELNLQGFKVVGNALDTSNLTEQPVFETPYSLLDTISPAYRQAFGDHLTDQLLKLQATRAEEDISSNTAA